MMRQVLIVKRKTKAERMNLLKEQTYHVLLGYAMHVCMYVCMYVCAYVVYPYSCNTTIGSGGGCYLN